MTATTTDVFTPGPDGIEVAESAGRLVLRQRTYRSFDWVHFVLGVPVGVLTLLLIGIGIVNLTLFAYSWWGESLFYLAVLAWLWFTLTRAFNRRTVTVTPERITSSNGPLRSLAAKLDVPVAQIEEVVAHGTKHMTGNLTTYRWHHVVLETKDGARLTVFKKLADKEAAKFVEAKIVAFLGGRGAGSG